MEDEDKKQPTQVDAGTLSIAPEPTAVAALVEGARTAFLSDVRHLVQRLHPEAGAAMLASVSAAMSTSLLPSVVIQRLPSNTCRSSIWFSPT